MSWTVVNIVRGSLVAIQICTLYYFNKWHKENFVMQRATEPELKQWLRMVQALGQISLLDGLLSLALTFNLAGNFKIS